MSSSVPSELTQILVDADSGDRQAMTELLPLVYEELRSLAEGLLRRERPGHTLQATALVHEAYLRLVKVDPGKWQNRRQFLCIAAAVMRHILVNHARDRRREKRSGSWNQLPLDEAVAIFEERATDLVALDEALVRLSGVDPRQARVVELRFFGGLTMEETAEALEVSKRTVEGDWSMARAWLLREISKD